MIMTSHDKKVGIIGLGEIPYGEHWELSLRDLAAMAIEVAYDSVQKGGFDKEDVGALFVGNAAAELFVGQGHVNALVADAAGMVDTPSFRIEAADASGAAAFRAAYMAIQSGIIDTAMVVGVEKMWDQTSNSRVTSILANTMLDHDWEVEPGLTYTSAFAMMARAYFEEFGVTKEQLSAVSAKNHYNASLNPNAHFRRAFTREQVMKSQIVADPLGLLDCSPITDGASVVILAAEEKISEYSDSPVWIKGSGHGQDYLALHSRKSLTTFESVKKASLQAFTQAGITNPAEQVDVVEVHDSFSIAELIALESMGFYPPGKAALATFEGETSLTGSLPVSPSGGLKAKGHPLGATGVGQVVELCLQLLGKAGKRQVKDAKIGVAQSLGGTGATSFVHVLEID